MKVVLVAALAVALAGCSPVATVNEALDPPLDWAFIESVGGIGVALPEERESGFVLPVTVDLSTIEGTGMPTGLVCAQMAASVQGGLINGRVYDIELRAYGTPRNAPALDAGERSCTEVPLALGFPYSLIPVSAIRQYRIWYREDLGERHLITTLVPEDK